MPKVTFLNPGPHLAARVIQAKVGETILDLAIQNDISIQHACGGFCACTTCHIIVKEGAGNISEIQEDEEERLERATGLTLQSRLGCQAKVKDDVSVQIVNFE